MVWPHLLVNRSRNEVQALSPHSCNLLQAIEMLIVSGLWSWSDSVDVMTGENVGEWLESEVVALLDTPKQIWKVYSMHLIDNKGVDNLTAARRDEIYLLTTEDEIYSGFK
jgi:hypothetical protein